MIVTFHDHSPRGGNLGVILVRVCEPDFETYPNHILGQVFEKKKELFIYSIKQNINILTYSNTVI